MTKKRKKREFVQKIEKSRKMIKNWPKIDQKMT